MKNRSVCFHCKKLSYLHASRCTYPVQIISLQVYDHKKFTLIFSGILKLPTEHFIFLRCYATFSCSLYRTGIYMTVFHLQKTFRRCTDDLIISEIQISAERRRIIFPKIIKNIQRWFFAFNGQLLRHIGNIDIALYNIADHPVYCLFVFFFLKVGMNLDPEFLTVRIFRDHPVSGFLFFPCFRSFLFPRLCKFPDCFFHRSDFCCSVCTDSI